MRRANDERGETSAEIAILAPVLFMCVFAVLHVATYWMSALTASAAATRGARAASTGIQSKNAHGEALVAIEETVRELGGSLADAPRISIDPETVRVTVTVRVAGVIPHLPVDVSRTVQMRLEQFVTEAGR